MASPLRLGALLALSCLPAVVPSADTPFQTVGRVAVRPADEAGDELMWKIGPQLTQNFRRAANAGREPERLLFLRKSDTTPGHFEATTYDYAAEAGFHCDVDRDGRILSRKKMAEQPPLSNDEFRDAEALVFADPAFKADIEAGRLVTYEAMPPFTVTPEGKRAVNVGIGAPDLAAKGSGAHEVVSVLTQDKAVLRYPSKAPATSRATAVTCGYPSSSCNRQVNGTFSSYEIQWPAASPVWRLTVVRPYWSSGNSGSGIELRNVSYKGHLVFVRAHVPILNVKYDQNACGPYRDWMNSENCFAASGTIPSPGIMVCNAAPRTFCENSGTDAGTFNGVSVWDEGTSLWLATEEDAGWYRYIMQWRLHLDGTIEPIFGYGATTNSCVCYVHHHHSYWRFDMAPDGVLNGDTVTGACEVAHGGPGVLNWQTFSTETSAIRPADYAQDWWRVRNPTTGFGYLIEPGKEDGTADGNTYAKKDVWVLRYRSSEISDSGSPDTSANLDPYLNNEALDQGRAVFWYRTGFLHDETQPGGSEPCRLNGPRFVLLGQNTMTVK